MSSSVCRYWEVAARGRLSVGWELFGSVWDRFEIGVTLGGKSSYNMLSMLLQFGSDSGSISDRFGMDLESVWDRCGIGLGSVWDRFG